jgi:hypothetical protein
MKVVILSLLILSLVSCQQGKKGEAKNEINGLPTSYELALIDEEELNNVKDYDFYLLYVDYRKFGYSLFLSLRSKDGQPYCLKKYMDADNSNKLPNTFGTISDSITYNTSYYELPNRKIETLSRIIDNVDFFDYPAFPSKSDLTISHRSTFIVCYSKDKGFHTIHDWPDTSVIERKLKNYLVDSLTK